MDTSFFLEPIQAFQGTVVNRQCYPVNGRLIINTWTVPLTENAAFYSIFLVQVGNTVVLVCARRTSAPGWTQLTVNLTPDPSLDKSFNLTPDPSLDKSVNLTPDPSLDKSVNLTPDPSLDKSVLNKDDNKISPTLVSSTSLKQNSCLPKVGL